MSTSVGILNQYCNLLINLTFQNIKKFMITVKFKHQSAEHKFRIHVLVLYLTVCIGSMLPYS